VVVLDSSFVVAYHNRGDVHHEPAAQGMAHLLAGDWGVGLLLEYVFLEVVTVLLARRGLDVAARVGTALLEARELEFVPCSDVFLPTLQFFRRQGAGRLSFTDCAIVTVARRRRANLVATFDTDLGEVHGLTMVPTR
jgi:predicted nucleic acid-binding protein